MITEKLASFSRCFMLAGKGKRVGLKFEVFDKDFSNHAVEDGPCR
jgi:hypothetical protein